MKKELWVIYDGDLKMYHAWPTRKQAEERYDLWTNDLDRGHLFSKPYKFVRKEKQDEKAKIQ